MKAPTLTSAAACILIGVGGFIAGRISSPHHPENQQDERNRNAAGSHESFDAPADSSNPNPKRPSRYASRRDQERSSLKPEPLDRLSSILRSEDPLERSRDLLAYISRLGPGDFESAIAHFRSLGITENRLGEYAQLLSAWAKVDPLGALAYAKANTRSPFATNTILTAWAVSNPEAAIQWAKANHEGAGANPYYAGIIRALAATDPIRAEQLLTSMPRSIERGEALDAIMPHILSQGAEATRAWIASLTDDSLRNGAMMRSAEQLAASDPAGTAAWLIANPSEATQRRMDDVYRVWARQNPQEAIAAFGLMPAGENRSNALRGIVNSMAIQDPNAAVAMLDQYPNDVTDRAVQSIVWHSFGSDPALAVSQISRIADPQERNRTYERMLQEWQERDPSAAQQWMKTNPLPQEVLNELTQ